MTSWLITTFFALVFQRAMKYWEKVIYTKTKNKKQKTKKKKHISFKFSEYNCLK